MNVTDEEINKFIGLFYREDYERVRDFLSSKKVFGIYTLLSENGSDNYIRIEETCDVDSSGHYISYPTIKEIRLDSCISKNDIDFVLSFISRYFENFKLIFSSSCSYVFVATTDNMSAVISDFLFSKIMALSVFYQDSLLLELNFLKSDAEVSDDMWKIITDSHNNINIIMHHAYISKDYEFSDKIKGFKGRAVFSCEHIHNKV